MARCGRVKAGYREGELYLYLGCATPYAPSYLLGGAAFVDHAPHLLHLGRLREDGGGLIVETRSSLPHFP